MTQVPHRRKSYFIDPVFQMRFIMKFCTVVVVSAVLIGTAMFLILHNSTTMTVRNTTLIIKPTSDFILPELTVVLLIVAVLSCLIGLVLTLGFSHKISGPMIRIKKDIELMKAGDLTRQFPIRSSDQLQELARSLEEMAQALRKKHLAIGGHCRSVANFLEEKNLGGSKEDRDKLRQMLKELYETVGYFKV